LCRFLYTYLYALAMERARHVQHVVDERARML
jgi:hypothetical protein